MPDKYTAIRVSKPVVRRLNIAKSLSEVSQQEMADMLLDEAMDHREIPRVPVNTENKKVKTK